MSLCLLSCTKPVKTRELSYLHGAQAVAEAQAEFMHEASGRRCVRSELSLLAPERLTAPSFLKNPDLVIFLFLNC